MVAASWYSVADGDWENTAITYFVVVNDRVNELREVPLPRNINREGSLCDTLLEVTWTGTDVSWRKTLGCSSRILRYKSPE